MIYSTKVKKKLVGAVIAADLSCAVVSAPANANLFKVIKKAVKDVEKPLKKLVIFFLLIIAVSVSPNIFAESCTGHVSPWSDVKAGEISSEIIIAEKYYMNPKNKEGTYEVRRQKLKNIISTVFSRFISKRKSEYKTVKCHYRGIDWNKGGNSSWKSMSCREDLEFDPRSIKKTMDGDWKAGPNYSNWRRTVSWKTGGHRKNETFIELDATVRDIQGVVIAELNTARKVLHDRGIPTKLP